uniref:AIG1-type G domain-containing protein n=1 Tax=Seriola lalandi dorsalis TaxID=1841481 RepID=A0A3B4WQD7_SERLL
MITIIGGINKEPIIKLDQCRSDLRIVLLGKTGAGKSSLCNTIFKEDLFQISHTANSETTKCQKETKSVKKRRITLIDTPGFFDPDRSEEELKSEIVSCITECAPGPHVFLIVLKVEKFSEQENEVIDKIKECFTEEAFKHAVIVFTHGEQLPEGMEIEEFVSQNRNLSDLVQKCGGRCHVVDNKYWKNKCWRKYRNNKRQVTQLLTTIQAMGGREDYYTNDMLQAVERKIQEVVKSIRQSFANIPWKEIREKAKRIVSNLLKKIVGVTTGVLLGALLGVPVMVLAVVKALMEMKTIPVEAAVAVAAAGAPAAVVGLGTVAVEVAAAGGAAGLGVCAGVAAAAGALVGSCIGYKEADQTSSVIEAAVNTVKAVFDKAKNVLNNKKHKESEEK